MARYFEKVKHEPKAMIPKRQTKHSSGYDLHAVEDVEIPSIFQLVTDYLKHKTIRPTIVRTGVKAKMEDDEALFIYSRSSFPLKKFLIQANGVGVVDADYYGNDTNDGEIMMQFINFGVTKKHIGKGDRIGQGIFKKFLKVYNDETTGNKRNGGHGSTGE